MLCWVNLDSIMFFNPVRLLLFIGWFYCCMGCVKYVEFSRAIPENLRLCAKIFTLFFGPLVVFSVRVIEFFKKCVEGNSSYYNFFNEIFVGFLKVDQPTISASSREKIALFDSSGKTLDEIYSSSKKEKSSKGIIEITERIIADAIEKRASDILIDPRTENSYLIRIRVDGLLRDYEQFDTKVASAIVNSIKAISRMDIAERRRPQDGSFSAQLAQGTISLRVASAGALNGEKLSIRLLNQFEGLISLKDIGMSQEQYRKVDHAINQPSGMILICGPTGSGKTTTLYSTLQSIDTATRNIISVEDPIEYTISNVSQIEVNTKADITFAKALRSVLRQDPDVICIGEIRDQETAGIAVQAAQTGHLVIATIHSNSNVSALVRLLDLGVKPLLLSSAISLIISQRLVRCLCPYCKSMETLSQDQIQKLGTKGVNYKNIYRASGCLSCDNTGYKGRKGVFDVMAIDDRIRKDILDGNLSAQTAKAYEERDGKSTMQKEAMKKVLTGTTTWQEVKRVVSSI